LTALSPVSSVTVVRPSSIRAKVSGGPNASDQRAISGEISIRRTTPIVPATKEPTAATPSAGPARPRSAIWCPSMQVTTDADSPGVLISTEVIVPAVHGAGVERGEHDDPRGRVHAEGERQQQRDPRTADRCRAAHRSGCP
jgi:hypothetical protein